MAKKTTSSAHTAGPWSTFRYGDRNYPAIIIEDEKCSRIAVVEKDHGTDPVAEANARLIAAAPDLLDLAETFWLVCHERLGLLRDDEKDWRGDDEWDDMVGHFTALQKKCKRVIAKAGARSPHDS